MTLAFPPIGLGTGGPDRLNDVDLMAAALEMGYRHIDTAQSYENEDEVGSALERADVPREDVLVATKIEKHHLAYDDVHETARESREQLGVDTIDLLYVHFPTTTYDPTGTLRAMDELVEDGIIDHIGLSNFSPAEVDEAADTLEHSIAANQIEMHPYCQQDELVKYAQAHDLPLVAYTPLARGEVFDDPTIVDIAEKHDTDPATVTLAWLTGIEGVSAIPMTTSMPHCEANLRAPDLDLDDEDVSQIDSIEREKKFVEVA